ncbi:MAG: response regulator transcription factor [Saprospiraceae bacterium]|nr:response regulator transcription factor [Saprospiraceae bacterium]
MAGGLKILILEDESLAAERLLQLILQQEPDAELVALIDTVTDAVDFFQNNPAPDLCFFDIQIADGLSFQIFEEVQVESPIIFTTAYDEYAIKAFKVNSVDYLLKPINPEELAAAFEKFHALRRIKAPAFDWELIQQTMQQFSPQKSYKTRFIVKAHQKLIPLTVAEVSCFYSAHKTVWAQTLEGKKYGMDTTLEQLEPQLDPARFFRVNRQFIVAFDAIREVITYSNSRLKLILSEIEEEVIVSRERVGEFKEWLGGNSF